MGFISFLLYSLLMAFPASQSLTLSVLGDRPPAPTGLAKSFDNIFAKDSVISHSNHHDIDDMEYFRKLKDALGNQSRRIFDTHKTDLFHHAICISLGAKIYGGLGNMIGTIKGAQMFAFTTKRNFILNNPVIFSMFDHPDTPVQSWRVPAMNSPRFVGKQTSFPDCGSTIRYGHTNNGNLGINRCNDNIRGHPDVQLWHNQLGLPKVLQHVDASHTTVDYDITQWAFSRPTVAWNQFIRDKSCELFPNCKAVHSAEGHCRADLAFQLRTWADLRSASPGPGIRDPVIKCQVDCLTARVLQLEAELNRSVCVFITSDNAVISEDVVKYVNQIPSAHAVYNHLSHNKTLSHSAQMISDERYNYNFNVKMLTEHPEFVDWMLLSEAASALHSTQSTFSRTARERAGIIRSLHDIYLGAGEGGAPCSCVPAFPNH